MASSSSTTTTTLQMVMLFVCMALALLVPSTSAAASDSALSVLESTDNITVGPSILAIVAIAVGAVMCVAGYRFFRYAIFVCGFIVGGIAVASAVEYLARNESWMNTASWIAFFVGGIIVGLLAMMFYKFSIFIAGFAGGVLLAFTIHTTFMYKIYESDPNVVLVILAIVLGIIGGVLAIMLEKPVLIISTAFIGAIAVVWGVGYFAGDFPNGADLQKYSNADASGDTVISVPDAWWGYLAGIVVLFALGLYIQFKKTGRQGNHHGPRKHHTRMFAAVQTPNSSAA